MLRSPLSGTFTNLKEPQGNLPRGKRKPPANSKICNVLRLTPFPSASSSMLGALKILLCAHALLSGHKCGDHSSVTLRLAGPRISTGVSPAIKTGVMAMESRVGGAVSSSR